MDRSKRAAETLGMSSLLTLSDDNNAKEFLSDLSMAPAKWKASGSSISLHSCQQSMSCLITTAAHYAK
jgi:hypothetical protein